MSRNGSGVYTLPAGNPVVTATAISSTWANNTLTDIANSLTGSLASDGQTPLQGNLNVNNYNLNNINQLNTTNINSTGTITGGTGVINYGSGQFYKDITGNIGFGTTTPSKTLEIVTSINNGLRVGNGTYSGDFLASSLGGMALTANGAYSLITYVNGASRTAVNAQGQYIVGNGGTAIVSSADVYVQAINGSSVGQYVAGQSTSSWWSFGRDNVYTGNFVFSVLGINVSTINFSTGVFTAVSDIRLKKNIVSLQYGLNEILSLRPVMYNMKSEDDSKKKHIGLIAQEVKAIIDELVEDIDEEKQHYGLSSAEIVPVLIKAIQELNAKINLLEEKIGYSKFI